MACKTTNFPNGINVGTCVLADPDSVIQLPDNIAEVSANYTVKINDDVVIGTGTFNVTLLLTSIAIKRITIIAEAASTITIIPVGSDTIPAGVSPLTTPSSITLVPTSTDKWLSS